MTKPSIMTRLRELIGFFTNKTVEDSDSDSDSYRDNKVNSIFDTAEYSDTVEHKDIILSIKEELEKIKNLRKTSGLLARIKNPRGITEVDLKSSMTSIIDLMPQQVSSNSDYREDNVEKQYYDDFIRHIVLLSNKPEDLKRAVKDEYDDANTGDTAEIIEDMIKAKRPIFKLRAWLRKCKDITVKQNSTDGTFNLSFKVTGNSAKTLGQVTNLIGQVSKAIEEHGSSKPYGNFIRAIEDMDSYRQEFLPKKIGWMSRVVIRVKSVWEYPRSAEERQEFYESESGNLLGSIIGGYRKAMKAMKAVNREKVVEVVNRENSGDSDDPDLSCFPDPKLIGNDGNADDVSLGGGDVDDDLSSFHPFPLVAEPICNDGDVADIQQYDGEPAREENDGEGRNDDSVTGDAGRVQEGGLPSPNEIESVHARPLVDSVKQERRAKSC